MSDSLRVHAISNFLTLRHFTAGHGWQPTPAEIEHTAVLIVQVLDNLLVTAKTFPPGALLKRVNDALCNADGMIAAGARQDLDAIALIMERMVAERDRAVERTSREIRARDVVAEDLQRTEEHLQREVANRNALAAENEALRERLSNLEREAIGVVELLVRQNEKIQLQFSNAISCGLSATAGAAAVA